MFTLAIYDQVSGQDLKAGRKIAGTGTIEKDGAVGDIGGAYLKVKSAADSGADIFFVPNNLVTKEMKKADPDAKTNYQEAKEAAEKLGTKMKIVPVKTAQEAIDYLKKTKWEVRVGQTEIYDFVSVLLSFRLKCYNSLYEKRYRTVNDYYREIFGEKIFKLPIDAGFDCPNRDGTVAHGGCTFVQYRGLGTLL